MVTGQGGPMRVDLTARLSNTQLVHSRVAAADGGGCSISRSLSHTTVSLPKCGVVAKSRRRYVDVREMSRSGRMV